MIVVVPMPSSMAPVAAPMPAPRLPPTAPAIMTPETAARAAELYASASASGTAAMSVARTREAKVHRMITPRLSRIKIRIKEKAARPTFSDRIKLISIFHPFFHRKKPLLR